MNLNKKNENIYKEDMCICPKCGRDEITHCICDEDDINEDSIILANRNVLIVELISNIDRWEAKRLSDEVVPVNKSGEEIKPKVKFESYIIKKVQDISLEECKRICGYSDYKACYNMLNENYKKSWIEIDNPYVFLISSQNKSK